MTKNYLLVKLVKLIFDYTNVKKLLKAEIALVLDTCACFSSSVLY